MSTVGHSAIFAIVKKDMENATAEMNRILAVEMFRREPVLFQSLAYPPTPWYRKAWRRVTAYLSTLWRALKGDELTDPCDCD